MAEDRHQKALLALIEEHGGVLLRDKNHIVYGFPNGKKFTMPSTPSDRNASRNQLSDLRKVLDIQNQGNGPGERRVREHKRNDSVRTELNITPSLNGAMAEKLALAGLSQHLLSEKVKKQEATIVSLEKHMNWIRSERDYLEAEYNRLKVKLCPCWWCVFRARLRALL